MTREEAITYLKVIWNRYKAEYEIERETLDAYHMAIEALSADTVPIEKYHELQHQFVMLGATFADLTEPVRCEECKYLGIKDFVYGYCKKNMVGEVRPDDYCSYGERRRAKK